MSWVIFDTRENGTMNRWMACALLVGGFTLFLAGCGTRELGPANPEDTPQVDEAEIQKNIEQSMPEQYRQQYRKP